jgi:hypothetical protein
LLYIGQAKDSLRKRLVEQELQHRSAATFFRNLGALLGFRPTPGALVDMGNQNNYRFSKSDTAEIVAWITSHLRVSWVELARERLKPVETAAVKKHRPLINTQHIASAGI